MTSITTEQLREMRIHNIDGKHDAFVLINVLPNEIHREAHIKGSINVPAADPCFEQVVEALAGGKTFPIVLYSVGVSGALSNAAGRRLEAAGHQNVFVYSGGIVAWRLFGLSIAKSTSRHTTNVHS